MKKTNKYITRLTLMIFTVASVALVGCNDNIADEDLYTYKPEMLSDYLRNNAEFSDFAAIVEKAGKMELLSTYGTYTCFAPTNAAVKQYLDSHGVSSIDALTSADCDTIASTLLVDKMYSMADLAALQGFIEDPNMLGRPLACEPVQMLMGDDSVTTYRINRSALVIYELANDSVDNGIVHPISTVAESSNQTLPTIMREDASISIFNTCLEVTGIDEKMQRIKDPSYDPRDWEYMAGLYRSHEHQNYCWVPQSRNFGFTAFAVPDSILSAEYGITDWESMYDYACTIYTDGAGQEYYGKTPEALKDPRNPLNKLIAYHLLDRKALYSKLYTNCTIFRNEINPTEWYSTMLPLSTVKVEYVYGTNKFRGQSQIRSLYLNRMYDPNRPNLTNRGAIVSQTVGEGLVQEAVNGVYYYIDRLIDYGENTHNTVFNTRLRIDFYDIWPELMTNDIRTSRTGEGDATSSKDAAARNYIFPPGWFDNVETNEDGDFIYQGCRNYYWSYEGDEFNLRSDNNVYDITFNLPSVPTGQYQIRLGFCLIPTRGIAQFYVDGLPQGIPLDMRGNGGNFSGVWEARVGWRSNYTSLSQDAKDQTRKELANQGWYYGPRSVRNISTGGGSVKDDNLLSASNSSPFCNNNGTVRRLIYTGPLDGNVQHTMRIRSTYAVGGAELMFDYLEIVPKSVYGIEGEGKGEDDL
jgi:hypothetical protein